MTLTEPLKLLCGLTEIVIGAVVVPTLAETDDDKTEILKFGVI